MEIPTLATVSHAEPSLEEAQAVAKFYQRALQQQQEIRRWKRATSMFLCSVFCFLLWFGHSLASHGWR